MPRPPRLTRFAHLTVLGLVLVVGALLAPATGRAATITSAGPVTEIIVQPTLACQARYAGDASYEFFPGSSQSGSCGPIISRGQTVVSFFNFIAVGQPPTVTGSGTSADPFRLVTTACAGTSAECESATAPLVTTDVSYVVGQDYYRTDLRVTSRSPEATETIGIYQWADCFLQNSDIGFGFVDTSTNGIYCSANPNNAPPARIEGFVPVDAGSSYLQGHYSTTFNQINTLAGQPLPNTCDCNVSQDNGMALAWTGISVPAGATVQRSFLTTFSPVGVPTNTNPPPPPPPPPPVEEKAPQYPLPGVDTDGDGIFDPMDNCAGVPNGNQADVDSDGIGDACDDNDASPGPTNGETVVAQVVEGEVFYRKPPDGKASSFPRSIAAKNAVPLKGSGLLPVGSVLDTTAGRVRVTTDTGGRTLGGFKATQRSEFYAGVFQVRQAQARDSLTDITLRSPSAAPYDQVCAPPASGSSARSAGGGITAVAAQKGSKKVVSRLWSDASGRFRTRGRNSAATVRGTIWLTQNRCDGTLTFVKRGTVSVRDLGTNRTVTVRAGHSYLARAQRASVKTRTP